MVLSSFGHRIGQFFSGFQQVLEVSDTVLARFNGVQRF